MLLLAALCGGCRITAKKVDVPGIFSGEDLEWELLHHDSIEDEPEPGDDE